MDLHPFVQEVVSHLNNVWKKIYEKKYMNIIVNHDYTYCFEIIYPQNKIVVDYGDEEDLHLQWTRNYFNNNKAFVRTRKLRQLAIVKIVL